MGRSYVVQGVPIGIPRYNFSPKKGDEFFISGKKVTIKRVYDDGGPFVDFVRSVDGTTGMSVSNLYQVARVPENSPYAPYGYRQRNPRSGSSLFTVRKSGDNYVIYFRGSRAEGPPHATRATAMKYAQIMESEHRRRQSKTNPRGPLVSAHIVGSKVFISPIQRKKIVNPSTGAKVFVQVTGNHSGRSVFGLDQWFLNVAQAKKYISQLRIRGLLNGRTAEVWGQTANGPKVIHSATRNPRSNPENFGSLPIGSTFKFASSDTTLRYSGGGRFLGQNIYRKIGATTYVPADEQAALSDLRKKYSGYPDIARKLNRKSITLRVGSKKAEIVRQ